MMIKHILTVFALQLCWQVCQAQQIEVPYEQFKLDNGLNVILHKDASIPRVSVNVWYHVGSGSESPGRTGFAHLFEHILFEGSKHVPEGKFDQWLEAAGASNNGSTQEDRTNYYEDMPSNALELALFLESDRMGYLLDAMSEATVDGQRDVVKNERRQSYENRPYGKAWLELPGLLYPTNHPYSWPVIGSMEDLSAASYQDVKNFFSTFYVPGNASLSIAGDIDFAETRKAVEKWFSDVPSGRVVKKPIVEPAQLLEEKRVVLEDKVQLPLIIMTWLTPGMFQPGDAEADIIARLFSGGKNSRLYKRLVYDLQIAQSVTAFQESKKYNSEFYIMVDARQGVSLSQIEKVIQEEIDKLKNSPPDNRELERITNQLKSNFINQMERAGGFRGKANQLNAYYYYTGNPDYFNEDIARYSAISASDISSAARQYLKDDARVIISVVPEGKKELAATK